VWFTVWPVTAFENYIHFLENFTIKENYNKQRACLGDEHFENILKRLQGDQEKKKNSFNGKYIAFRFSVIHD
jgi:hypothetical protein